MLATVSADIATIIQHVGTVCQLCTALIAATVGVITFRYTKRQSALTLINHNNSLANLVNKTVIDSAQARDVLGRLQDSIVGYPDDAVLFMYLNYVHNTYRMNEIGAVSVQVWQDTLSGCVATIGKLHRDQVVRLLARGYESRFQMAVLARYDEAATRPRRQHRAGRIGRPEILSSFSPAHPATPPFHHDCHKKPDQRWGKKLPDAGGIPLKWQPTSPPEWPHRAESSQRL